LKKLLLLFFEKIKIEYIATNRLYILLAQDILEKITENLQL